MPDDDILHDATELGHRLEWVFPIEGFGGLCEVLAPLMLQDAPAPQQEPTAESIPAGPSLARLR